MALPKDYKASYPDLYHLFSHPDLLDQPSVILAARLLIPALPRINPDRYATLVGRCLARMYALHMLVATDPLLLAFLEDVGRIAKRRDATPEALFKWYHVIFSRLLFVPPLRLHEDQLRRQVGTLLQHLLYDLDQLSGTSHIGMTGYALPLWILDKVLHPRLVSAPVREMVIARAERTKVDLTEYHWSLCLASAVKDKNRDAVGRYFEAMQKGRSSDEMDIQDEESYEIEGGSGLNTGEGSRSTDHNIMPGTSRDTGIWTHVGSSPRPPVHAGIARKPSPPSRPLAVNPSRSPSVIRASHDTRSRSMSSQAIRTLSVRLDSRPPASPSTLSEHHTVLGQVMQRVKVSLTQGSGDLETLYNDLEPLLSSPDAASPEYTLDLKAHQVAWSNLFHGLAITPKVTADDLLGLWNNMPSSAIISATISPLMQGLIRRHRHDAAWQVWTDHVQFVARTPAHMQSSYIDARNVLDATAACDNLGFNEQIAFLDYWAQRPNSLETKTSTFEHSIPIDAFNVNELMLSCKRARSPSVPLRLWAAAGPRWGVKLDTASLAILLDTTRLYEVAPQEDRGDQTVRTQLKLFFAELSASRLFHSARDEDLGELGESKYGAYEADGFSKGSHGVLLDPPGFYWHKTHGTVRPWEIGRAIFRQVVLGNWPHLSRVVNPLDPDVRWNGDSWYSRYFGDDHPSTQIKLVEKLPLPTAKYMHLVPDAVTWSSYIRLLGFFGHVNQIPLALAWMKELGVRPTWVSMVYALAYIKDSQDEPRRVRDPDGRWGYASDEEIVREYCVRWLGEGKEVAPMSGYKHAHTASPDGQAAPPSGLDEQGKRWKVPSPEDVIALRHWFMGCRVRFHHRE